MFDGIFRSTDNGENWIQINCGLANSDIRALTINSDENIFAGTIGYGIYGSSDYGETWVQKNNGLTNNSVRTLVTNSNGEIFAGTYSGVFLSTDNGDIWMSKIQV